MATNVTPSQQIYLSKDKIRQDLIENFIKEYLELENVDLTQSSYLSFLVDVFSTLTSNILFYQSSVYREFFLTTAQLPESVLNLSRFLGYNTREAVPSSTNLLVSVPLENFEDNLVYFKIPGNGTFPGESGETKFRFYAGSIEFINDQKIEVYITKSGVPSARIKYTSATGQSFITNGIITNNIIKFLVPVRQGKKIINEFQVDSNLRSFQFYDINVPVTGNVASLQVKITPPELPDGNGTFWTEYDSLYLMSNTTKGYVSRRTDTGRKLFFGNDLMGVQPKPGSKIEVFIETTEGESGNVIKGSITTADRIYHSNFPPYNESIVRPQIVEFTVINPNSSSGGADEESIDEIRVNAIDSLTSLSRLVSENDYKNLKTVVSDLPIGDNTLPILKRSDTRINEIQLYANIIFDDEIVPTRSIWQTFPIETTSIKRNQVLTDSDGEEYLSLFDLTFNASSVPITINSDAAYYKYYISSIEAAPILEDTNSNANYNVYATNFTFNRSDADSTSLVVLTYFSDEVDDSTNRYNLFVAGTDHLRTTATITLLSNGQEYDLERNTVSATITSGVGVNSMTIPLTSVPEGLTDDSTGWVIFNSVPEGWQTTNIHAYRFTSASGSTLNLDPMYLDVTNGYEGTVEDYSDYTCQIILDEFSFKLDGLEDEHFDEGVITFFFSFFHPEVNISGPITTSSANITINQSADQFMLSNMTIDRDSSSLTIYDIPVVKKSYYEELVAAGSSNDFELLVMQKLLAGVQFHNYRMLTDFLNFKFTNTTGFIRSFQYNRVTKSNVHTRQLTTVPDSTSVIAGDSYIINGSETGVWKSGYTNLQLKDKIATWDGTDTWIISNPSLEEVVIVEDEFYIDGDTTSLLKIFYSEFGWIIPDYEIPIVIECEIYTRQDYSGGDTALVNSIKTTLIDAFSSRFGSNISLHRSEIIDVIHNVEGIDHVRLISPKTSIYFDFETTDLSEVQLLKYGPEYIFFDESSIVVRIR